MTDKAQYDGIAEEYQASKQLPFRIHAEQPLLFELVGDVKGKAVLDLACGEGIYARSLRSFGATTVVGVDLSSDMIRLAGERGPTEPMGIRYEVGDAATLGKIGDFDLVVGSYLLNYARSADQLAAFCRSIIKNLKPGGRFVGMNDNPASDPARYPTYRKYGFVKASPARRVEGDPVTYTMFNADGSTFHFDNYYLSPETYESVLTSTGFRGFRWHRPVVTAAGLAEHGEAFWLEFLSDPPVVGISAWI